MLFSKSRPSQPHILQLEGWEMHIIINNAVVSVIKVSVLIVHFHFLFLSLSTFLFA